MVYRAQSRFCTPSSQLSVTIYFLLGIRTYQFLELLAKLCLRTGLCEADDSCLNPRYFRGYSHPHLGKGSTFPNVHSAIETVCRLSSPARIQSMRGGTSVYPKIAGPLSPGPRRGSPLLAYIVYIPSNLMTALRCPVSDNL